MHILLAYIDPASGTLLLQALVAAAIGGMAYFRRSIWAFLGMFTGRRSAASASDTPAADRDVADPPA